MRNLKEILSGIKVLAHKGKQDAVVASIEIDSRKVSDNTMFVAIKGSLADGHHYIDKAIANGASVIVCEHFPIEINPRVAYIQVADTHAEAALFANNFYNHPSAKLQLIGITGTNGKTTIATILFKLFTELGYRCGLISTVQNLIGNQVVPATHTTPDAVSLNALLSRMVDEGCTHVFMECSSHAIHQKRIKGLVFRGGVFTNITHDHLDYHKTFDEYIRVKKTFFDELPATAFAITNIDDKRGAVMLQNTKATKYTYSLHAVADFKGKILEDALSGLLMLVNNVEVHFRLIGAFNAYNILAIYGVAVNMGEDGSQVLRVLSMLTSAEGRFDYIVSKTNIIAIVDYAHTPDALQNVLTTIKKLNRSNSQIITVIGCGGDRDMAKRPLMAEEAASKSNRVILTSDNPRSEEPQSIIQSMEVGLNSAGRKKTLSIVDRKEAIKVAVSFANTGDIILIAGKGHEKYQEINGVKHHFDDKEVVKEMFELLEK